LRHSCHKPRCKCPHQRRTRRFHGIAAVFRVVEPSLTPRDTTSLPPKRCASGRSTHKITTSTPSPTYLPPQSHRPVTGACDPAFLPQNRSAPFMNAQKEQRTYPLWVTRRNPLAGWRSGQSSGYLEISPRDAAGRWCGSGPGAIGCKQPGPPISGFRFPVSGRPSRGSV
jgi:hypothetical protein